MTHPFEAAGLGIAPFRLVAVEEKRFCPTPGMPSKPGGTCDHCGASIVECCVIADTNGKKFTVGSVCVNKTDDLHLTINLPQSIRAAKRISKMKAAR